MRTMRGANTSVTTLVSLGVIYLLVVGFAVAITRVLILTPEGLQEGLLRIFVGFGVLFPAVLLGFVVVSAVRLFGEFRRKLPGGAFKGRLSIFFVVLVLLAAVPQGIIAVTFLSSALELVFSTGAADAVRRGLDITLAYYDRELSDLQRVARDGTLERLFADESVPDATAVDRALRDRLHRPVAVQILTREGRELVYSGDERFRTVPGPQPPGINLSRVTRLTVDGIPVLRLETSVAVTPPLHAVVTTRLPDEFEETARSLTEARDTVQWFEELRPRFVLTVATVYGVFVAPILLLSMLTGFFLADRIMQPIESLEEATNRVALGDYSVRILARPSDDLGLLVLSFNKMVNELDRARQRMVQAEKVQAWQEIAQRLAHEVKNPLTPIRLAAERLQRRYHGGAEDFSRVLDRTVTTIVREVEELTALLDEFRSFARMPRPEIEEVSLADTIRQAAAVFADDPSVHIDTGGAAGDITLPADRAGIRRVLQNLVANAVEAADGAVNIRVRWDIVQKNSDEYCRLRVEDDGPGIPQELGQRIFDPYVTTKQTGTGLGLAIVERIIFDHGGAITYESAPGSGTTFIIDLPMVDRSTSPGRSGHGNSTDS